MNPITTTHLAVGATVLAAASPKRLHDPLLEELWAIKAQINEEGGYDLATILARAKAFADPYFDASGCVRVHSA